MKNLFKISPRSQCETCYYHSGLGCLDDKAFNFGWDPKLDEKSFHRLFYYWYDEHIHTPIYNKLNSRLLDISDKTEDIFQQPKHWDLIRLNITTFKLKVLSKIRDFIKGSLKENPRLFGCSTYKRPVTSKWTHIGTIEPVRYTGDRNSEELLAFINGCIIKYPRGDRNKYIDMNGDIVEYIRKLLSTDPIKSSIAILNHSKISN